MEKLIQAAIETKNMSYSPYSNYKVGAAVLFEDGKIYTGTNIENASYPVGLCAERLAIAKGIEAGNRKIKAIAIHGDSDYTYPCGMCRQFINEFKDQDTKIILVKDKDHYKIEDFDDLLPKSFGPKDLK